MMDRLFNVLMLFLMCGAANAQWIEQNPFMSAEQQADGVVFRLRTGVLTVKVCADSIFHVTYAPDASVPKRPELIVTKAKWPAVQWSFRDDPKSFVLRTARMSVAVDPTDSTLAYTDSSGKGFGGGQRIEYE